MSVTTPEKHIFKYVSSLFLAPCVPANVSAIVDCASDSALVSWSASVAAENYSVTALGSGGQVVSCSTQQNRCNISSLYCGQLYELALTTTNQQCEITTAINVTFQSSEYAKHHGKNEPRAVLTQFL